MDFLFAIATGVVSGVVSAGLLFVSRTMVAGHLLPWYHDLVYRGINVDGDWYASGFVMAQDMNISIKQRAGSITGDAQFTRREEGTERSDIENTRTFSVEGRIQDRYITLTLSHKNRQRIGVVSLLLEPVCDGRQLRGIMSFVSIQNNLIDSVEIHFARDRSIVFDERRSTEEEIERQRAEMPRRPKLPPSKKKATPDERKATISQLADGNEKISIE